MSQPQTPSPPKKLQGRNKNHVAWLFRRVWDRVNTRNLHFMFCVVGEEGSGKSQTAIRIASEIDPTFTADRVMFDVVDLLKVLKEGKHEPGNFYVLDEAGVQFGRRTWQERGQILANQALQLVRDHNLGLIFTLPRLGELDSQVQGRLQGVLELIDKEDGEYVTGKWKWTDPDRMDETGKIYKPYPKRRIDGKLVRVTRVSIKPPEPDVVEPYNEFKREFQKEFYQETIDKLEGNEEDGDKELTPKDILEKIKDNGGMEQYVKTANNGSQYVDGDLIGFDYEIPTTKADMVKKAILRELSIGSGG